MGEIMPFLMVIAIVAIVFAAKAHRTQMMYRQSSRGRSPEDEQLIAEMASKIDKLSTRVAVLEKLVTDEDRKLASEIERLRGDDRPSV